MLSRADALLKGVGAYYLVQVLVLTANLLLAPYTISKVGLADYGKWLVAQQVVTYLGLAQFGVALVLPRELQRVLAGGDVVAARGLVNTVLHQMVYFTSLTAAVAIGVYLLAQDTVRGPIGVILLGYTLCHVLTVFVSIVQGMQDLTFHALLASGSALLGVMAGAALLAAGWGLYGLALGWCVGYVTLVFGSVARTAVRYPHVFPTTLGPIRSPAAMSHLRAGCWQTLNALAVLLMSGTDVFLVAGWWGPEAVAAYGCTSRLALAAGGLAVAAATMAVPGLAGAAAAADQARKRQLLSDMALCQLVVTGLVIVVVLAVNRRFVGLWVGSGVYAGDAVTVAVAAVLLARHLNTILLTMAYALGRDRNTTLVNLLDGAVTALVTAALVAVAGPPGGHLGGFLVAVALTVPLHAYLLGRMIGPPAEMWQAVGRWTLRFAPLAAIAYLLGAATDGLPVGRLGSAGLLIGMAGVIALVYAVFMYPLIRPTPIGRRLDGLWSSAARPVPAAVD